MDWMFSLFLALLPVAGYAIGYKRGKEKEWLRRELEEAKANKLAQSSKP